MDDLLGEFLTETSDSLTVLDVELVKLEQTPNDPELLSSIFRLVHTIKGTCGFLGLPRLESVAHAAENVLGKFRDGALEVTPEAVTLILASLDTIKMILATLEATEEEPGGDDSALIGQLNAIAEGKAGAEPVTDDAPPADVSADADAGSAGPGATEPEDALAAGKVAEPQQAANPVDELPVLEEFGRESAAVIDLKVATEANLEPVSAQKTQTGAVAIAESRDVAAAEPKESAIANQSIRVGVPLLEDLMTMVSELVLTRNQLLQILRGQNESEFAAPLQRLNHVTSELQEGVMKTRMQPIGNAWAKLPRLIRDLSQDLGKKIELEMHGAETELDRQVLELIKDPLTHMVRNSADHGIESTADRLAAGKTEAGTVRLNAYHEGGHIHIEVSDDGKGLSVEKIKERLIRNEAATEAELAGMTDQQIHQYIFRAGFSTAAAVTNVSGRGVGMDVVKTNIEKIGGTVELKSVEGRGSTFLIKIPLTLAIVSALIVECGSERFAVPQISVVELVKAGGQSEHTIEKINGSPVLRLRDRLLPLINLRGLLKLPPADSPDAEPSTDGPQASTDDAFIIVIQVGTHTFGLIVDRVFDTEEIVVKPVAPILRHIEIFSGNTILGDGSVIMILDPNGIAMANGEIGMAEDLEATAKQTQIADSAEKIPLLLFRSGRGAPKAVPLALVARLEDIEIDKIESADGTMTVQYRGNLMPVLPFDDRFDLDGLRSADGDASQHRPVLVFADGDRSMGLIVDEIVDITEQAIKIELSSNSDGVLGSAIVDGKATDVIDAQYYLTKARGDWFRAPKTAAGERKQRRVLLVDDSPFFRNMLTPMLSIAGYQVTAVASADEAIALRDDGEEFDVIVSDIEMPGMDGFAFAAEVKGGERWSNTPIVALSSHASKSDLDRGRAVGFNDYVAKLDRDALLDSLSQTLADARGAA